MSLFGIYAANHPSLGRDPFSVTTFEVQVFRAYVSPETLNLVTHHGSLLFGSERIFRNKYLIPDGISSSFSTTSF